MGINQFKIFCKNLFLWILKFDMYLQSQFVIWNHVKWTPTIFVLRKKTSGSFFKCFTRIYFTNRLWQILGRFIVFMTFSSGMIFMKFDKICKVCENLSAWRTCKSLPSCDEHGKLWKRCCHFMFHSFFCFIFRDRQFLQ